MRAAWADHKTLYQKQVIPLLRGQLASSMRQLGRDWGWDKNRVSRHLEVMRQMDMIRTTDEPWGMIVTICNYEIYQGDEKDSTTNAPETHQRRTGGAPPAHHEIRRKEGEEEKNPSTEDGFLEVLGKELPQRKYAPPRVCEKSRGFIEANFEDEPTKKRLLEFVGLMESEDAIPLERIFLSTRQLWNLRQQLEMESLNGKADVVFRYSLDAAIKKGIRSPNYVATTMRNAIMKVRDGVKLA